MNHHHFYNNLHNTSKTIENFKKKLRENVDEFRKICRQDSINASRQKIKDLAREIFEEDSVILERIEVEENFFENIFQEIENEIEYESYLHESENCVKCPICLRNNLFAEHNHIKCLCGLAVFTENDSISLSNVKDNIISGLNEHSANNCISKVSYDILSLDDNNMNMLTMHCNTCQFMHIII